ncbi:MAG: hypothetical protein CMN30_12440 [Sandaracinus sp.]|nr:hypothetical protein [Sandaracinus sp.]|tara:strand:- start:479 stop:1315 length:837 start_codon:yes stop_codon:yes gene_type:complete
MGRLVRCLGLVWVAGCAVDVSGFGGDAVGSDAGVDLGRIDGDPDMGSRDLGVVDLGGRDAGTVDLGPPDLGPPDLGPPPYCNGQDGLVGCYTFDGASAYADESGNGNDLIGNSVNPGLGAIGTALWLNGSSSLFAEDSPSLDPSARFSVELFLWVDDLPNGGQRRGVLDKNGQFGIFLYAPDTIRCSGGGGSAETTGIVVDRWTHVACTHDGSTVRLYVDGDEVATGTGGAPGSGNAALHLGEDSPDGDDQLVGRLDEVRLWTRVVPPEVIRASADRL